MIYLQDGKNIYKYDIVFDKEKIEKLRIEIINNCSEIVHKEIIDSIGPDDRDILKIRNLVNHGFVGIHEYFEEDVTLYKYTYDEYQYPYIISLIDKLLSGKYYYEMFKNSNEEFITISEKINDLSKNIMNKNKINDLDYLEKLKELIELQKYNKNQISAKKYYEIIDNEISFNLIDSVSLDEITKVMQFIGITHYIDNIPEIKGKLYEKTRIN